MQYRLAPFLAYPVALAGLLAASPVAAQRSFTLDEALALARAHNRDLEAARARLEQSAANSQQAWAALLPQVAAQGVYTHNYEEVTLALGQELNQGTLGLAELLRSASTDPAEKSALEQLEQQLSGASSTPIVIQKSEQLSAGITAAVPIIVPYAYPALAAAREAHAAHVAGFSVTEATVLLAVAQTYYAAAGCDELVLARANAVTVARQTLDDAKALFHQGTVTRVEVMRAEVAVVRAEQAEVEAEDTRAQAYRALATMLGVDEPLRAITEHAALAEPPSESTLVKEKAATSSAVDDARSRHDTLMAQLAAQRASAGMARNQAGALFATGNAARARALAAQSDIEMARAAVTRAQVAARECQLPAPRGGMVASRNMEPGEAVQPGSVILSLTDVREARTRFYLPNDDLAAAAPGRKVAVVADAYPGRIFEGTIFYVSPRAEFTPRNVQTREDRERLVYAVDVRIANGDMRLRAGMPVEVEIEIEGSVQ